MTHRQVETSREVRLWITGILGPVIIGGASILANNPELRSDLWQKTKGKCRSIKNALTIKKKEAKDEAQPLLYLKMNHIKKIIAVDFDGCLVVDAYPNIGPPIYKNIERLKKEKTNGARIILWTCRVGKYLEKALEFCKENDIQLDCVNENHPDILAAFGTESRKIFAHEYWDDRAVLVNENT